MKKKLIYSVVSLLTIAGIVSCGTSKEEVKAEAKKSAEITVQAESSWVDYYKKAAEKVMKENPGDKINVVEMGSFDLLDKLDKTDATNPDITDVFAFPLDRLSKLSQAEALASFDAKALAGKIGGFGDYDKGLGGQIVVDGAYLGFPFNIETLVTFVNTKNAKNLNIDLTKPVELVQKDVNNVMIAMFNAWFAVAATNAGNIELLGKTSDGFYSDLVKPYDELSKEQKMVIDQLFKYWQKANAQKTTLFDAGATWGYIDEQFKDGGKAVLRIDGPWSVGGLSELSKNLDVLPIGSISVAGEALRHWKGGWALGINARIEEDMDKKALAEKMIAELMNRENAAELFKVSGKIMPNVSKEEYAKSNLEQFNKKVIAAVIDSYEDSVARPLFKEWDKVWDTWQNGILSWNTAQPKNAKEAYNELSASFKAMMQNIDK
ncbi:sugar ABC transporter substrate-binding protein [Oceanivirga miroungae]|uniref:Maltodextrin-binding protein MdxE n=1 Tax=Oceanivirga miroungae TaxID=1130046 RepID=A0A6I8MAH2_9FUSO|nr:extracellular solute-binding protein [Oceanivirga miroungae]VWL85172.1 Maltodextrin-binding protein MdxE [Oceanivirga miroungae]